MAEKKRRGRRSYLNDFVPAGDGAYIYTGKRYSLAGNRKRFNRLLLAMTAILFVLVVGAGCFPSAGMLNTFYVLLIYIGEAASLFAVAWSAISIAFGEEELKRRPYETHVKQLPIRLFLLALFSILHIPASVLSAALEGMGDLWITTVICWICELLAASLSFWARKRILALEWREHE